MNYGEPTPSPPKRKSGSHTTSPENQERNLKRSRTTSEASASATVINHGVSPDTIVPADVSGLIADLQDLAKRARRHVLGNDLVDEPIDDEDYDDELDDELDDGEMDDYEKYMPMNWEDRQSVYGTNLKKSMSLFSSFDEEVELSSWPDAFIHLAAADIQPSPFLVKLLPPTKERVQYSYVLSPETVREFSDNCDACDEVGDEQVRDMTLRFLFAVCAGNWIVAHYLLAYDLDLGCLGKGTKWLRDRVDTLKTSPLPSSLGLFWFHDTFTRWAQKPGEKNLYGLFLTACRGPADVSSFLRIISLEADDKRPLQELLSYIEDVGTDFVDHRPWDAQSLMSKVKLLAGGTTLHKTLCSGSTSCPEHRWHSQYSVVLSGAALPDGGYEVRIDRDVEGSFRDQTWKEQTPWSPYTPDWTRCAKCVFGRKFSFV